MTLLLHDYCELEERAGKHLRAWKIWHLVLYTLAAIFGAANYILLQKTMQLVDNNCVLYPRELEFHVVARLNNTDSVETNVNYTMDQVDPSKGSAGNGPVADTTDANLPGRNVSKREVSDTETTEEIETTDMNVTVITGNQTHRLVLDPSRSLFGTAGECQFAEYMPVMSTISALLWVTLFTMCPGGGRPRSGLQQPWRILTPALLFALVFVALTGHSFAKTNGGLQAFCAAFVNVTNSTTCSSVDEVLEESTSWGFGARAAATRAASAGAWAAWACAAALLLARCLAAPDFVVKRTGAYLKDPHGKLTPYLKKGRLQRSPPSSPGRHDNVSVYSEPTATTEVATASVEPDQDSTPTSLMVTPVRRGRGHTDNADLIEMTYSPQERHSAQ